MICGAYKETEAFVGNPSNENILIKNKKNKKRISAKDFFVRKEGNCLLPPKGPPKRSYDFRTTPLLPVSKPVYIMLIDATSGPQ